MDKEKFKKFLETKGNKSFDDYVKTVRGFEKWLGRNWNKSLDEANESDLLEYKKN